MKKTFLSALLLATALTTGGAKAETIFEALSTAYDTNPTLQAQRAYLRSVDENVAIAKSGFRPNIYLTGGYSDSTFITTMFRHRPAAPRFRPAPKSASRCSAALRPSIR